LAEVHAQGCYRSAARYHQRVTTRAGIRAARARSVAVDELVAPLIAALAGQARVAAVALGAYGRQELTPAAEAELLVLHDGTLSTERATQAVWYPLFERTVNLEPALRTVDECVADAGRSIGALLSLFDVRLVAGDPDLLEALEHRTIAPIRHDRRGLRRRLGPLVQRRHAGHPAVTVAAVPDLRSGRGGLQDLQALRWLEPDADPRITAALDFVLCVAAAVEETSGHAAHRFPPRLQERAAVSLGYGQGAAAADALMADLYRHARRAAFALDGALAEPHADRSFGLSLSIKRGRLVGERLASLERVPTLGLRVAHLIGLAPPSVEILDWAAQPGPPVDWDDATRE